MVSKARLRAAFVLVAVALLLPPMYGYATAASGDSASGSGGGATGYQSSVAPRDGITVIATDSNSWLGREADGPRANAELIAYAPDGSRLYYNDSHTRYWDVDPVSNTRATVEYVAADHVPKSECGGETVCTRNVVERVNLTTGNVTRLYSRITPKKHSTRWHDVDRIGESRLLVADIARDRVYVYNTSSGLVEWEWSAQEEYSIHSGGPYPSDWTHLNDVEQLPDGRIMVSLRNQDQVVFLDPETGLVDSWTLGRDDAHDVLYEQHNPDYIPKSRGGPAVVAADSENNRLVEYQRRDGSWHRTWQWSDSRLQWPRDADRLPNGHTLVTDSNGNRVFELDQNGNVVWKVEVAFPYEAERLGTGDESAGGPAKAANGSTGTAPPGNSTATNGTSGDASGDAGQGLAGFVSFNGRLWNSVAYVLPVWMTATELTSLMAAVLVLLGWVAAEIRWAPWTVSVRNPVRVGSDRK